MIAGEIKVVMTLDDRDFTVKTMRAGETLSSVRRQVETTGKSMNQLEGNVFTLGSKFKDLIFTISMARFALRDIQDIFLGFPLAVAKAAGEFEKMQKLMEGLSKETSDAKKELEATTAKKYVINMALNAPFSIGALSDAAVKLKTGGIDPLNGSLQALVDSVAKFGGSEEQLKRAGVAIQQMAGKGVVSMEELRQQLGEAVPDAIQMMAEGLGMSMSKMINIISKGQLEAGPALERMFAVMAIRNEGKAKEMMDTWNGLVSQMNTRWELFKTQIAESGGESSFFAELKKAVRDVNALFDSQEGKAFAADIGSALRSVVSGVRDAVTFFREWSDVIKLAGTAFMAYFAASKISESVAAFRSMQQAAGAVVAGSPNAKSGGLLQSVTESVLREREATAAKVSMVRQEFAEKIKLNQQMIAENQKAIDSSLANERRAHAEKVRMAAQELTAVQAASQAKIKQASDLTQQAGKYYAQAVEYENKINAIDNSGKSRQGAKRAVFVEQMEFYRQETVAVQQKAVALRNEAVAEIAAANAKLANTRASKDYLDVAKNNVTTLTALNQNLLNNVAGLTRHADATVKATIASRALNGVIAGARTIWTAFGGWVTVAISILFWAGEKLMEFMNRWQKAAELQQNIKNGLATEEGNKALEARLKEAQGQVDSYTTRMLAQQQLIASRKALLDKAVGENNKRALRSTIEEEQKALDTMAAQREVQAKRVLELETSLRDGRQQIQTASARSETEQWLRLNEDSIEKKVSGLKETDNRLRIEAEKLATKAKADNPTLTADKLEALTKDKRDEITQNLAAINAARLAGWQSNENQLRQQLTSATGATRAVLEEKLKVTLEQIDRLKLLQKTADQLGDPVQLLAGNKPTKYKLDRTDPLTQLVNESKAKLEQAKLEFAQINRGTDQLLTDQQAATFDVLKRLANGDFDSKEDKKQPALGLRKKYIEDFITYIKNGGTDVEAFINKLGGLDDVMEKNGPTVRQNMLAVIQYTTELGREKEMISAISKLRELDAEVSERMAESQAELAAGSNYMSSATLRLTTQFEKLGLKLDDAQKKLIDFYATRENLLLKQFNVENDTAIRKLLDDIGKAQIDSMTDGRAKKDAEHQRNLDIIEKERAAKEKQLRDNTSDELLYLYERGQNNRRANLQIQAENLRYFTATKTELQKLQESWKATFDSIDKAAAGWGESMMSVLDQFVDTGQVKLKDFVSNFLKDVEKMALRNTMGDVVGQAAGFLGKQVGSLFGVNMGGIAGSSKDLLKDPTSGALLVRDVGKVTDDAKTALTKLADGKNSFFDDIKSKFSSILDFFGNGFKDVISWIGSGLSSLFSSGVGSSGGGGLMDIASTVASFFFADGGIMTSMGPVALRKYANGGIASSPQLALFGEGKQPEAYVPLPDGRTIPVTLSGAAQQASAAQPTAVTVNVINQTNQQVDAQQTGQRFDGKQMILDVVLSGMSQPGPFRDNTKSIINGMRK